MPHVARCFRRGPWNAEREEVTDLVLNRWNRYGKRRLYVNLLDGRRVGWCDLVTKERHLELSEYAADFERVLQSSLGDYASIVAAPAEEASPPIPVVSSSPAPEAERWPKNRDLALHRPGELARARARAEWETAKEDSFMLAWGRRFVDTKTDERSWRVGARGEETVGGKLEKLTKRGWRVLHSVPVGSRGSDIDHVLIGPGGVFTLNTKRHPQKAVWIRGDTVKVDGFDQPYVRNSRHEAERARRLLSEGLGRPVPVTGALVFLTATPTPKVTVRQQPQDVLVLDLETLVPAFKRREGIWSPEGVDAIFEVARWSRTWI